MSIYQIAKSGHRSQEHIFVVKSIIALYIFLQIPLFLQFFDITKFFDKESLRDGMNTIYNAGINGKIYRLWCKLNNKTKISVKTGAGVSNFQESEENIGQGTIGGAIISAANLDDGVQYYFDNSKDEVSYGTVRIQPLLYQDDILRMTTTCHGAQAGLDKIVNTMESKLLDVHPDKTCHLIIAEKNNLSKIREELKKNPLKYKSHLIKEKDKEKWLGDLFHREGLSQSVHTTIRDRSGRTKIAIFEINAILEDSRMQIIGGIQGAIDIWNMAVIPSLLNNCETWTNISEEDFKELEELQNLFLRVLFQVPISCPKPALCWETASLTMSNRIKNKKLTFYKYLQSLNEESLASQVFKEQQRLNFPGLIHEVQDIANNLKIGSELDDEKLNVKTFKKIAKLIINEENEKFLKNEINKYSKLEELKKDTYGLKDYFKILNLEQARTKFRLRTKMIDIKFNFKNKKSYQENNWLCDSCESAIESQSHVLWCPAYSEFREGKRLDSDKDLVTYISQVLKVRNELRLNR